MIVLSRTFRTRPVSSERALKAQKGLVLLKDNQLTSLVSFLLKQESSLVEPVLSEPVLYIVPIKCTANLHTNILDFRGFDSSIILILRSGITRTIGNSPEVLSQAILVGIILVGRLGV